MLMGMRGAKHRFMPNRLVFPGGAVDRADLDRAVRHAAVAADRASAAQERQRDDWRMAWASPPRANCTRKPAYRSASPPRLDVLHLLARAVTPPPSPIRFNARFFAVDARHVSGTLGGDGELEELRFYAMQEALALDLAMPTRRVLERLRLWLAMTEQERAATDARPGHAARSWLADGVIGQAWQYRAAGKNDPLPMV